MPPIAGPHIEGPGIDYGGGTVLFTNERGFIECLEIFAYGDRFPEDLPEFTLLDEA